MFPDDDRIGGGYRGGIVVDTRVGDDEVEVGYSLGFEVGNGVAGVCGGFAVDFHGEEFVGGVFGEEDEVLV